MKNIQIRPIVHIIVLLMGLGLIIGGIIVNKYGAVVVGIIAAAVNVQQWMNWNKQRSNSEKNKQ